MVTALKTKDKVIQHHLTGGLKMEEGVRKAAWRKQNRISQAWKREQKSLPGEETVSAKVLKKYLENLGIQRNTRVSTKEKRNLA